MLSKPRVDLTLIPNADLIFHVDGSYLQNSQGKVISTYAVCLQFEATESGAFPGIHSAQIAEFEALFSACPWAAGHTVKINNDSRYAFCIAHDCDQLWKYRGLLTAQGTPIKNGPFVEVLFPQMQLFHVVLTSHQMVMLLKEMPRLICGPFFISVLYWTFVLSEQSNSIGIYGWSDSDPIFSSYEQEENLA